MLPSDYFFSKEIFLQFLQLPWVLAITLSCRQQKISWQPCGGRGPQISPEATLGVLKVHRWTQNSRALRQEVILATGLECISLPPKAFWRHWRDLFGLRSYFILDLFLSFDVHITVVFRWEAEAETRTILRKTVLNLPIYSVLPTSQERGYWIRF